MSVQTARDYFSFRGAYAPPVVASRQGALCSKITGAGPPTVKSVSGGSMDLALTATSEVQVATLYMGDILPYDIDDLIRITIRAKLTAALAAAVSGVFGLATAQNDALDSLANFALFKFDGSNAIVCETDDGGSFDLDDKPTGLSLVATYRRFVIDFATGLKAQSPPSLSKGGTADVRFCMSNDRGALTRVAGGTGFDLSAFTSNLQLFAQIQKTTGTAVGTLSLLDAEIEYRLPA